jgi:pyruvate dehydrogenase E2 component (dihydrolipoamide acetyltransferase)
VTPVLMPQVGENLKTGIVVEWYKAEMDPVLKGEALLAVESEKAVFEVTAEESGVLLKILHGQGDEVAVLDPVAFIGGADEAETAGAEGATTLEGGPGTTRKGAWDDDAGAADAAPTGVARKGALAAVQEPEITGERALDAPERRRFASPAARRLVRERGLRLTAIAGSGPGGRIIKRDVLQALAGITAATLDTGDPGADGGVVPFSRVRRHIAQRMTLSASTKPHFYLSVEVDMTAASYRRQRAKDGGDVHPFTITDLLIKATASTLVRFERLNAHVNDAGTALQKEIHIGVATAGADGLLVPVIPQAQGKSLAEISRVRRENSAAAARGVMRRRCAGTFTITNLGMYGISRFLPLINPPECAILAAGAVEERVVARQGQPVVRDMMTLTLACDHRAIDGDYGARFLTDLKAALEDPTGLL